MKFCERMDMDFNRHIVFSGHEPRSADHEFICFGNERRVYRVWSERSQAWMATVIANVTQWIGKNTVFNPKNEIDDEGGSKLRGYVIVNLE